MQSGGSVTKNCSRSKILGLMCRWNKLAPERPLLAVRIQPISFASISFDAGRKLEWLETNGLGGFASSTIIGMNTRRYHGLLTAATKPPVGRVVLLSKMEETLVIGGERFELAVNQYPGAIH